jgi:hypothetical protein
MVRILLVLMVAAWCGGCDGDGTTAPDDCRNSERACELMKPTDDGLNETNVGVCLDQFAASSFECHQGCAASLSCSPGETCVPLDEPSSETPRAVGVCVTIGVAASSCASGAVTVANEYGPRAYRCGQ